jgi:hypothetical protein
MKLEVCVTAASAIALLVLSGCATQYHSAGMTGGYSETQLQTNLFSVSFDGNAYTRKGRATDLALLRCAELTIRSGYRYFVILDSATESSTAYINTPTAYQSSASVQSFGNVAYGNATTVGGGSVAVPLVKPSASFSIMCFSASPGGSLYAYDADFLLHSVAAKYGYSVTDGKVVSPKPKRLKRWSVANNRWE